MGGRGFLWKSESWKQRERSVFFFRFHSETPSLDERESAVFFFSLFFAFLLSLHDSARILSPPE